MEDADYAELHRLLQAPPAAATLPAVHTLLARSPQAAQPVGPLFTALHLAAKAHDAAVVSLVAQAWPPAATARDSERSWTPLHVAAAHQGGEQGAAVVAVLIAVNRTPLAMGEACWRRPLHVAAEHQGGSNGTAVVEVLIAADPQALTVRDESLWAPLHIAASHQCGNKGAAVVKLLAKAAPQVLDMADGRFRLPIHIAVHDQSWYRGTAVVEALVEAGPQTLLVGVKLDGWTPLHLVAWHQKDDLGVALVQLLVRAAPAALTLADKHGNTPLHLAAEYQRDAMVELLTRLGPRAALMRNKDGATPLHIAARYRDQLAVRTLIEAGPQALSMCDHNGSTPLEVATRYNGGTVLQILIQAGPLATTLGNKKSGLTPLHIAAQCCGKTKVEALIRANPLALTMTTVNGSTPLHSAASANTAEVVAAIASACPLALQIRDQDGWLPADVAAQDQGYLKGAGALEATLTAWPQAAGVRAHDGTVPLHLALNDNLPALQILLQTFPRAATVPTKDGKSPLAWLVSAPRWGAVQVVLEKVPLDCLLPGAPKMTGVYGGYAILALQRLRETMDALPPPHDEYLPARFRAASFNPTSTPPHPRTKANLSYRRSRFDPSKTVALKVIRAIDKYFDAAKIELKVLQRIKEACEFEDKDIPIALLQRNFVKERHMCMVFDLYGANLYEVLRASNYRPMPEQHVIDIGTQCLDAICFLHRNQITHTDLKPENILIDGSRKLGRDAPYAMPIRIIDLGSATLDWEHHSEVVSTRQYRALEVILGETETGDVRQTNLLNFLPSLSGLGWSHPIDVWSLGCILAELWTGRALFQTHQNTEHMALMEKLLGRIPASFLKGNSRYADRSGALRWPAKAKSEESLRYVADMRTLGEVLKSCHERNTTLRLPQIESLVFGRLHYRPGRRLTAAEARAHDFFKPLPPAPHVGTSAPPPRSVSRSARTDSAASILMQSGSRDMPAPGYEGDRRDDGGRHHVLATVGPAAAAVPPGTPSHRSQPAAAHISPLTVAPRAPPEEEPPMEQWDIVLGGNARGTAAAAAANEHRAASRQ